MHSDLGAPDAAPYLLLLLIILLLLMTPQENLGVGALLVEPFCRNEENDGYVDTRLRNFSGCCMTALGMLFLCTH